LLCRSGSAAQYATMAGAAQVKIMVQEIAPSAVAEGKYVYCIIQSKEPRTFGPIGIGARGDAVYTVHYEGLAAVVSGSPLIVYDPTRENVFAHEQVNEI